MRASWSGYWIFSNLSTTASRGWRVGGTLQLGHHPLSVANGARSRVDGVETPSRTVGQLREPTIAPHRRRPFVLRPFVIFLPRCLLGRARPLPAQCAPWAHSSARPRWSELDTRTRMASPLCGCRCRLLRTVGDAPLECALTSARRPCALAVCRAHAGLCRV